jgi:hypothetical protein
MQRVRSRDRVPGNPARRAPSRTLKAGLFLGSNNEITQRRRCYCAASFSISSEAPTFIPRCESPVGDATPGWRNPDHFADCSNFEQSLLKMVTRRKRWSTSAGSGWPQGKSGGPSLGRSPARTSSVNPSNQDQIQIFGEIGSTQFLEQGFPPCSFFRDVLKERSPTHFTVQPT